MRQVILITGAALVVLLVAVPSVRAVVCTPNICDTITCDNAITEKFCADNGQVYKANGGFCGCCPACITILKKGERCLLLRGVPPKAVCEEGTLCINNVCTPTN